MVTVAIISEYNPFHTGHKYHIEKIREQFGSDTRIIAIMSGNYTQRGDIAIMDKSTRAECAVTSGVNLVLELPFPFSISSAEIFAKCGVRIANEISVTDYISFGSENGNIKKLSDIADNMLSLEYRNEIDNLIKTHTNIGYPVLLQKAYNNIYTEKLDKDFFTANNILAIEYIKQIKLQKSHIIPHTIKRLGADYNNSEITESKHQSATAIRLKMKMDFNSALSYIPSEVKNTILNDYHEGQLPTDAESISSAIISHFRLNSSKNVNATHDIDEGLYNRLRKYSFKTNTISKLTELADTKKYTRARIKRAIWYSFFGVTSSEITKMPEYTQILAMDSVGKSILKEIKKMSNFPVLTKPSATSSLSLDAKKQKERSDMADSIFQLSKPKFTFGDAAITKTPFILD